MSTLWKDEYLVGNILIDAEHRYAVSLIEAYQDLQQNSYHKPYMLEMVVRMLAEHITTHFNHEQTLMEIAEQYSYTGKDAHLDEHTKLKNEILPLIESGEEENILKAAGLIFDHTSNYDSELAGKLNLSIIGLKIIKK